MGVYGGRGRGQAHQHRSTVGVRSKSKSSLKSLDSPSGFWILDLPVHLGAFGCITSSLIPPKISGPARSWILDLQVDSICTPKKANLFQIQDPRSKIQRQGTQNKVPLPEIQDPISRSSLHNTTHCTGKARWSILDSGSWIPGQRE